MRVLKTVTTLLMIGGLASLPGKVGYAQEEAGAEISKAWAILQRGDCDGAWNILWPLAKNGDLEARYYLLSATLTIIPPDVVKDPANMSHHLLTLSAYAALRPPERYTRGVASDGRFARINVPAAISGLNLGEPGERVAQCYKAGEPLDACLQLGISLGVIPKFEDYARDTDRRIREAGAKARCVPRRLWWSLW